MADLDQWMATNRDQEGPLADELDEWMAVRRANDRVELLGRLNEGLKAIGLRRGPCVDEEAIRGGTLHLT